jgi:fibronectin-binding autotransporter adhesin
VSKLISDTTGMLQSVAAKNAALLLRLKKILVGTSALVAVASTGLFAGQAQASDLLSFDTTGSLSGWTTYGSVTTKNTTVSLTLGTTPFSLTPAIGEYMAVITPSGNSVNKTNIDSTLGLTSGTINTLFAGLSGGNLATNFGVLTETVTLSPGTYTFYWSYAAQDYKPYNDGVLFSLSGSGTNTVSVLASNGPDGAQNSTVVVGSYGATQWASSTFTIATSGTYQIGFAAYNWEDQSVDPILYIGNSAGTVTSDSSSPIGTDASYYLASNLGSTVTPTFQGGTLQIDTGNTITSNFTVGAYSGNTIDADGHIATLSGTLSGTGGMTFTNSTGSGQIVLSGANAYNGSTTITGVTLVAGATNTLSASSVVTLSNTANSVLNLNGYNQTILSLSGGGTTGGNVWLGSATLTISNGGSFSGVISGGGNIVVNGGTLTLAGDNTFSGTTTVASGATLQIDSGLELGTGTLNLVGSVSTPAYLNITSSTTIANAITVSGDPVFDIATGTTTTISGTITDGGGVGDVVKQGDGTLILTGTNTYSGGTIISAGTLQIGDGSTTGSIVGDVTDNAALIFAHSDTVTFASTISGSGGLTQAGSGTLILTGTNTYNGATTINGGATLALSGTGSIANSSVLAALNGTFDISGTTSGASIVDLSGSGSVVLGDQTLTLTNAAGTFSGVIGGTGGLTIAGGNATLAGDNSYSGATTIASGATLFLSGSIANSAVADNGTFDISGTTGGTSVTSLSGSGTVVLGAQTLTLTSAFETFTGVIGGTGGLTIAGGSETLTGANTYNGATTINSGATLALSGSGSLANASVADNGAFDISGTTSGSSIASLSGSGVVTLGAKTLTLTSAADTFSGVLGGTGGLTVAGGSETLTGISTYTGATTINAGATLFLTGTGSIAASVDPTVNGTFDISGTTGGTSVTSLSGSGTVVLGAQTLTLTSAFETFAGVIGGTGGLTIAGGSETLTGTNTYNGATTISAGTLQIGAGGTTGSIASASIVDNAALVVNRTNTVTYGGVISGTGTLTQAGTGMTILTGTNTYTGVTTISAGTLQIGAAGTAGAIASRSIVDNAALIFNRTDTITYGAAISGSGKLTQAGTGTLILNGINTYTGLTTVAAGKLEVGDASHTTAKVAGAVTVASSTTLLGHGTISGAVTNTAGGTVAPGSSAGIGTLTVGSYTQGATSTLAVEISPTTASLLSVISTATLNGTLSATFDAGTYTAAIYPVVKAASISGTFSTFTATGALSDLVYGVYYAPSNTEVDIVVSPKSAGQIYGDLATSSLDNAITLSDTAFDHAAFNSCTSYDNGTVSRAENCDRWSTWSYGLGGTSHTEASNAATAFNTQTWGYISGLDYHFDEGGSLNAAIGYTAGNLNVSGASSKADTDAIFLSLAGHAPGKVLAIDASVFIAFGTADITRDSGVNSTITSNTKNTTSGFSVQFSHPLVGGDVVPLARVTYAYLAYGPINENGGTGLNLTGKHGNFDSTRLDIGILLNHVFTTSDGVALRPQLLAALDVEGSSASPDVAMNLANSTNTDFIAPSAAPDKVAALIRLGVEAKLNRAWVVDVGFDSRFGSKQQLALFHLDAAYHF